MVFCLPVRFLGFGTWKVAWKGTLKPKGRLVFCIEENLYEEDFSLFLKYILALY